MLKHNITAAAPDIHRCDQVRYFHALFEFASTGKSTLTTEMGVGVGEKNKKVFKDPNATRVIKRQREQKELQLPPLAGLQCKGLTLEKGSTRVALPGLYTRRWTRLFLQWERS